LRCLPETKGRTAAEIAEHFAVPAKDEELAAEAFYYEAPAMVPPKALKADAAPAALKMQPDLGLQRNFSVSSVSTMASSLASSTSNLVGLVAGARGNDVSSSSLKAPLLESNV